LLKPHATWVDVWLTTYHHVLAGRPDAVVAWFKGSGLRPFLAPLDEAGTAAFLAEYRAAIALAYPPQSDGSVLLPFPRLFIVATRQSRFRSLSLTAVALAHYFYEHLHPFACSDANGICSRAC
jgi:trans-aconitate methyltransferase